MQYYKTFIGETPELSLFSSVSTFYFHSFYHYCFKLSPDYSSSPSSFFCIHIP